MPQSYRVHKMSQCWPSGERIWTWVGGDCGTLDKLFNELPPRRPEGN